MKKNPFELEVVSIRLVKDVSINSGRPITSPVHAIEAVGNVLCEMDREVICVINTNAKGVPINCSFVSMGAMTEALAHPREMLKASILSNAVCVVLVHNHPSGDLFPSPMDIKLTERFMVVCNYMGLEFLDHVIVGGDGKEYFSFEEADLLKIDKDKVNEERDRVASLKEKERKKGKVR